jgi:hypothetical protein
VGSGCSGNRKKFADPAIKRRQQTFNNVFVDVFGIAIDDAHELGHGNSDTDGGGASLPNTKQHKREKR